MVGRGHELEQLKTAYSSDKSEFVAVYGRRRVGKTFLISECFANRFAFSHAGMEGASLREQLENFRLSLWRQGHRECPRFKSWLEAFSELEGFLDACSDRRKVVFIDELPWLDTPRSGFLRAFESFWNGWASLRKDIVLVICGSATSWIVKKVLRNRGGLHNRVTCHIPLRQFTLAECEEYARYAGLGFDRLQILECYMAMGGVAYYWSLLKRGESAAQNLDRIFFGEWDVMRAEFKEVFSSLFKDEGRYVDIITALGRTKAGMTREEIVRALGGKCGGEVTKCLEELESCGFVRHYRNFGNEKKGTLFQLIDCYTIFYFRFLENPDTDGHYWSASLNTTTVNNWRGLAFERVCLLHIAEIKAALGIAGILSEVYSWQTATTADGERGAQIDLLIDRSDRMINLCEMKYADGEYELKAAEYERIRHRRESFKCHSRTTKGLQLTLVTPVGLKRNKYWGNVQRIVTLDDLFGTAAGMVNMV